MRHFIIIVFINLLSCSLPYEGKSKGAGIDTNTISDDHVLHSEHKQGDTLTNNVDIKFETFLLTFSKDSLFQVSRIVFPLKAKVLDISSEDLGMVSKKIERQNFLKLDFTYDKDQVNPLIDSYTQEIQVKSKKAQVIYRGIENGFNMTYYFEKRNGKWMLVGFEDYST